MDTIENAIEIKDISKKFKIYHNKESQLKYVFLNLLKGKRSKLLSEFWALKHVDLDIKKGQTVGFIGRNGSGKSTLLKLISRILYPDGGIIETNGKISTLIELGSGFHPDLTGRENVYINASILGFSRADVTKKFKDIVDFSGLEDFIDNPVKTYSSGMYVRLGFSVAINIDPDILLVDEVLAVGDENFQKKCIKKIMEFKKEGKTIIFVSHDLKTIEELCDHVVLLHNGHIEKQGTPVEVISEYHRLLVGTSFMRVREETPLLLPGEENKNAGSTGNGKFRWGTREIEISGVTFLDAHDNETVFFKTNDPLRARIWYNAHKEIENPVFGIAVYSDMGIHITGPNTRKHHFPIAVVNGEGFIEYEMEKVPMLPGTYVFSAAVYDFEGRHAYDHWEQNWKFHVIESQDMPERLGLITIPAQWRMGTPADEKRRREEEKKRREEEKKKQ
ncbi:MAG: ABC transporter ATP-binding protein [Acidobacteria bacterium]|jgi:ABC-type polysaccharide/polyol phosphate transport system ATPase subunit|nr:ABC transporter ATP-binding protein [Acidobacteriota bacterium]